MANMTKNNTNNMIDKYSEADIASLAVNGQLVENSTDVTDLDVAVMPVKEEV
jgi:hypothetical protein